MKPARLKAAVLISGTGSNLNALIDAIEAGRLALDIVRVVSSRASATGINHANAAALPVSIISQNDHAIAALLKQDQVELIILAGYMRILGKDFTDQFEDRMINLHPSLLPRYKGLNTYNRALQAGDTETGASIHIVTAGLDAGTVITQVKIPILPNDDAGSLARRLGPLEHQLLVATVELFCDGKLKVESGQLKYLQRHLERPLLLDSNGTF